ncbi:MAG: T9SS type A sorting domain-containing protein, partial [Candidatus Cloacimonetes bacterium]|nr:T9SS type A sorting domain-containing protein [Candidatus Cloacimonadota bacterium]
ASIYNVKGQLVKTLVNNQVTTRTTYVWNGTDNAGNAAASGLYFVKIQTASSTTAAKMMMVK